MHSITDKIINNFITEINKRRNKFKIMKYVIEPILNELTNRYYPYFLLLLIVLLIIVVILIVLVSLHV